MKLPHWLVIAMLTTSVLSVLAAAGWCRVTWPERTAREFLYLMSEGSFDEARRMLPEGGVLPLRLDDLRAANSQQKLDSEPRDLVDVIEGTQRFRIAAHLELIVQYGKVVACYP